jgi:uncharacterized protein YgfB (UPF0149 family)
MDYQTINTLLLENGLKFSAAETHGLATGMLCTNDKTSAVTWFNELILDNISVNVLLQTVLEELFEETRTQLANEEYGFQLFLPSDDFPLIEQLDALQAWCQGFLYGIGSAQPISSWPESINDILKDIIELTKIDTELVDANSENDFIEITEYLRTASVFISNELNADNNITVH